jgi:hypothetical protein
MLEINRGEDRRFPVVEPCTLGIGTLSTNSQKPPEDVIPQRSNLFKSNR